MKVRLIKRFKSHCKDSDISPTGGTLIKLALILLILLLLVIGTIWVALADDVTDEEAVNRGAVDLVSTIEGYNNSSSNSSPYASPYSSSESVQGEGFSNINDNLAVSVTGSPILDLKHRCSGTGSYNYISESTIKNNTILRGSPDPSTGIDYVSSDRKIRIDEYTNDFYSEINLPRFNGSFQTKTPIRSLWKDQITSRNYAGIISMDYRFDYAQSLDLHSLATMTSDSDTYPKFLTTTNSTIISLMNIFGNVSEGTGHIGATKNDLRGESMKMKDKTSDTILMDEDYKGTFHLYIPKMEIKISKITNFGDYDRNSEGLYGKLALDDYSWLPCICNMGWDGMTIHDQRYHSTKNFFDCATCWPPAPCPNNADPK